MRRREEEHIGARNEIALRGGERRPVRHDPATAGPSSTATRLAPLDVLGQFPYDFATRTTTMPPASTVAVPVRAVPPPRGEIDRGEPHGRIVTLPPAPARRSARVASPAAR